MRNIAIAILLSASPALAADLPTTPANVVREFVTNTDATDWMLDAGWTWSEGVLTHWPGTSAAAQQITMPTMTAGKLYLIQVTIKGCTRGSVTISLGGNSFSKCDELAGWDIPREVSDPSALLTLTPTSDFDGSVSFVRVVELGDELVDQTSWVVPADWSQDGGQFTHAPGSDSNLERIVAIVRGRTYRLYFGVVAGTNDDPAAVTARVSLAQKAHPFNRAGNYEYEIEATDDNGWLTFSPRSVGEQVGPFEGVIRLVSVREITSDPASSSTETNTAGTQ